DFCYQQLGGNLVTVGSAFDYSNLGCSHHCYGDFALLKTLARTEIVYPASPLEFDILFREAYRSDRMTLFRIPGHQHEQDFPSRDIRLGKAIKVTDGGDLTLVATGPQLANALAARESLGNLGWDIEILYLHTIRPLDVEAIRTSVMKTHRVLVVEEHMRSGGLGDDVLRLSRNIANLQYSSLSIPDAFVTGYGSYEDHLEKLGLTPEGIVHRVATDFRKKGKVALPSGEPA
ncbi:MAG: transketolase C-terminal domain-containing protein, partial [Acidobacteriota bacterium]